MCKTLILTLAQSTHMCVMCVKGECAWKHLRITFVNPKLREITSPNVRTLHAKLIIPCYTICVEAPQAQQGLLDQIFVYIPTTGVQTNTILYEAPSYVVLPTLSVRHARVEDHDELLPVLERSSARYDRTNTYLEVTSVLEKMTICYLSLRGPALAITDCTQAYGP